MSRRENTFRVDYSNMPRKPSIVDVHDFIGTVLNLAREDVSRIQFSRTLGCAFVKTTEFAIAKRVVDQHDLKHEVKIDDKTYKLKITLEDGAVEVKIFDLSEDVTNAEITSFLSSYGEVLSIRDEIWDDKYRFAGIATGVRIARMLVKTNIPSYVTIGGETTCVSYYGQDQTCRHCGDQIHNGISCVQNKKLMYQKSYAHAAKHHVTAPKQTASLKQPTAQKPTTPGGQKQTNTLNTTFLKPKPIIRLSRDASPKQCEQEPSEPDSKKSKNESSNDDGKALSAANDGNDTDTSTNSNPAKRRVGRSKKGELNTVSNVPIVVNSSI